MKHLQRSNLSYPGLWRGCVGAWAPCLGPTGLTLRDWSGFGNHGTLTNMDAAGDWAASGGRYALDFDGSNDHVLCSSLTVGNLGTSNATLSVWVNTANANASRGFINKREFSGSFQQWSLLQGGVDTGGQPVLAKYITLFWYNGGALNSPAAVQNYRTTNDYVDGKMHHFAVTRTNGTIPRFYVDGNEVAVTAVVDGQNNINADSTKAIEIGSAARGAATVLGQVDDARVYSRALSASEIRLLASRRGIAYETNRNRQYNSAATAARLCNIFTGNSLEIIGAP